MAYEFIEVLEQNLTANLILNRPSKRNAMHGPMIAELIDALKKLGQSPNSRILVISGRGENFCAGGDIAWMQQIAASQQTNVEDAQALADVLFELYHFPKPTLVLAHGATLGGGLGLLSAADIAIAAKDTIFGLPEVKIGLTPSMISPYVITAIGERAAHYYFLTGERFGAEEAYRLGLIHHITSIEKINHFAQGIIKQILENSPRALYEAKQLIRKNAKHEITKEISQQTAKHLATLRATPEAQEGLRAFLEKRPAKWN